MKLPIVPIFVLGLLLVFTPSVRAVSDAGLPQYIPRTWQSDHGLPHNSIYAALQARDGYLWVGTPQGLARFDGARFKVFNPGNTPELKGQIIRFFYQTRDGKLWIGTDNSGLTTFQNGRFEFCSWPPDKRMRAMLQTRDGSIWLATGGGLAHYTDGKLQWFTTTNGLPNNIVLSLCEDTEGNLWVGTNDGLVRYQNGFHEVYRRGAGLNSNSIRSLVFDREGNLWIGTNGGGLSRLRKGELVHFNKHNGLPDDFVWTMCEDSLGQLWIGTYGGLCRRVGEKFIFESNSEGASYEMVFCLTEDREKNIWVGTKEGLDQLTQRLFFPYTKANGLSHNNAIAVREDSRGRMLITTWGGGLNMLQDGRFTVFNQTNALYYDVLLSVCDARDGSIWIGTDYDGGVFQMIGTNFFNFGRSEGIIDNAIRVLHEDRAGNMWIGTSGALYLLRDGRFQRLTRADGLPNNTIRAICEDSAGQIWIGTSGGLSKFHDGKFSNLTEKDGLSTNQVLSILEDKEHTFWIGTEGGGLNRFRNGKFTAYTTKQGLFNNSIFEILEDDQGYLWMSCFSGVFRVRKKDLDDFDRGAIPSIGCLSFGKTDGLSSVQCNGIAKPAGWKSKDGRLWFPTTRGVVVVDPASIHKSEQPLPLLIEEVVFDKSKVPGLESEVTAAALAQDSKLKTQDLVLPAGRGELEIRFTALTFHAPEKSRFRYKLEGVDSDWVEANTRRVAYYNHIYPGRYRFVVMASNNDGGWNRTELAFVLLPHFWQTKWFLGAALLAGISLVGGTARYATWKKVRQRLRRLEEEHAVERERARIARDMHDDLGVRLTELLLIGDRARKADAGLEETKSLVGKMSRSIREVVDNLDAIVWAVNPQNDSLNRFVPYICEYIQAFLEPTTIRFELDIPDDLPDCPLSSEARHQLYMVIRESLNNTVKHSQASEVTFRLKMESSKLVVVIADNGKGFSLETGSAFGNGLRNMHKRIASIDGYFNVSSEPGKGTSIEIQLPVH